MPSPTDREKHNKEGGWNGGLSQTTERFESNLTAVDPVTGEIKKSVHLRYMARQGDADAVRRHIGPDARSDDTELITAHVRRIEVRRTEIAVTLLSQDDASSDDTTTSVLAVPWSKSPHRRRRDVIALEDGSPAAVLPIRSDARVKLVIAIARGRQWLSEIETGTATIDASPHGRPAASATSA
jgi:hypothetical protein